MEQLKADARQMINEVGDLAERVKVRNELAEKRNKLMTIEIALLVVLLIVAIVTSYLGWQIASENNYLLKNHICAVNSAHRVALPNDLDCANRRR